MSCLCRWSFPGVRGLAARGDATKYVSGFCFSVLLFVFLLSFLSIWIGLTPDHMALITVLIIACGIQRKWDFICVEETGKLLFTCFQWERVGPWWLGWILGSSMTSLTGTPSWLGSGWAWRGLLRSEAWALYSCYPQIEEALVRRKKMELLQKYASETLQAQSEEAKRLLGY